jgi:fatty-acyl-CoA synthase
VGFGNPDLLAALVRSRIWPTADLSSVRFLITGGAPVPEPLIGAYLERGLTLLQGYGLSEAAPVALLLQPDSALSKVGSAGTPPLFVDTKIVGSEDGAVGPFQTGELIVRGPNVIAGYCNRPEETAEVLSADGWLRTGDAARSDEDGYIWIVGRIVDSFISRGQVVHPGDVERVLLTHPGVAEAGVAAASGSGAEQVGTAFVVLGPGRRHHSSGAHGLVKGAAFRPPAPCPRDLGRPPALELSRETDPRRSPGNGAWRRVRVLGAKGTESPKGAMRA